VDLSRRLRRSGSVVTIEQEQGSHLPGEENETMPQSSWSAKRERQYAHIKEGLEDRGRPDDLAEEIAARTVNKERARTGEATQASATSVHDLSSARRGGLRSHDGAGGRTYRQLYADAKRARIKGRSSMTKSELVRALGSRRTVRSR
jgi:hypothetical protein